MTMLKLIVVHHLHCGFAPFERRLFVSEPLTPTHHRPSSCLRFSTTAAVELTIDPTAYHHTCKETRISVNRLHPESHREIPDDPLRTEM